MGTLYHKLTATWPTFNMTIHCSMQLPTERRSSQESIAMMNDVNN